MTEMGAFLAALREAGVRFSLDGDALRYAAPPALAADLRDEMIARKEEIRAALRAAEDRRGQNDAIEPAQRNGPLPLSFAQQRLWFLDQWQGGSPIYNEPAALRLEGRLDVAALERSLNEIVQRHAVFRTTYRAVGGQPEQVVHERRDLLLPVVELGGHADAVLGEALRAEMNAPFDLGRDLMLRAKLFRLGEEEHVLALVMHHIVSDGWSAAVLIRELKALYAAFRAGKPSPLPPLPIQYADFAAWQRSAAQSGRLARELDYWKRELTGAPDRIDLPTDRPRPPEETFHGARYDFTIGADVTQRLRALAQAQGATLFMVAFAAFNVLLHRYSGQDTLVIGSPIANRDRRELEPLVGFFVNTLALRSDLSGDPAFTALLAQVKRTAEGAFAHQALPFERLVEALSPRRNLSHAPLFQVMFGFQNAPSETPDLPDLRITVLDLPRDTAKFDLILFLRERDGELIGTWEYNTDLFLAASMARKSAHFARLLESIADDPARPISRLSMLSKPERHALVQGWNDTDRDYPREASLQALFDEQAARMPDATAVSDPAGRISYRALQAASNRLAHHLLQLGVEPGAPVGIALERSTTFVVAALGILKAGGAYVPLDPAYPRERIAFMLEDCAARFVVTDDAHAAAFADLPVTCVGMDDARERPDTDPGAGFDPAQPAYIIYTSGSTGRPKGVMAPHRGVIRLVRNTDYVDFSRVRRIAHVSNVSFDAATFEIWGALLNGGEAVVVPQDTLLSPDAFADALRAQQIDAVFLTSALFNRMADSRPDAFGGLSYLLTGGERMHPERARRVLLSNAPPRTLQNVYGPTETTTFASWFPVASVPEGTVSIPLGRPIANTRLYVLDRARTPAPVGAYGELYVGGDGVALGYRNRPALTAERFLDNPFGEGRLYRTGDRAWRRADGTVEFAGRLDHQIKLRGFRIEPGEIEETLRTHPEVGDAIVMPRETADGEARLVAWVIAKDPGAQARSEQVSQWQTLFDTTYGETVATRTAARLEHEDATRNFTGWESSYTGEPIPACEMQEWLDATVAEIRALGAGHILEIGCGTGLLLARLAPGSIRYHGTDFSQQALAIVEAFRKERPDLAHVTLSQQGADDGSGLPEGGFDLVILNSTVQYFPDIAYLLRVLENAAGLLRPGGRVYLGDLRNHDLHELFHASVQGHRAAGRLSPDALRDAVRQGVTDEEELLVAPGFFRNVAEWLPDLVCERVGLKRGRHHNELTRFRYQVVLRKRDGRDGDAQDLSWTVWSDARPGLRDLREILLHRGEDSFALSGVPNARLAAENALLGESHGAAGRQEAAALDPEDVAALGEELGFDVRIGWSEGRDDGAFDVLFRREARADWRTRPFPAGPGDPEAYANNPLLGKLARRLAPELRDYLKGKLPDYMQPALYQFVSRWPLTPNGKVDRAALPEPGRNRGNAAARYVAPRSQAERAVAAVWQAVLGLDRIGIHDNFFEIGGHSLLATQIVSRLRDAFGTELGLRAFFDRPTVAELAAALDGAPEQAPSQEEFVL